MTPGGTGPVDAVEVIRLKRDGGRLTEQQIRRFVQAYTAGEVADEQAAALCMAIVWRGLSAGELWAWTDAMVESGTRLDLSTVGRPTVDKHSTGGVGDKISLALVPLVAACGAAVPQLAGRGLGHTGGTLDKLEAVPGTRVSLTVAEVLAQLADPAVGCVICAAGADLAPADRRLYALRDVTGTVESLPLIASSIMAKKVAEGTGALVLDVKVGDGAFMADLGAARRLAETMVELGAAYGVRTTALLTAMDAPLGRTAGNALEVGEALEVLAGRGPSDVSELTVELAREMLGLADVDGLDPGLELAGGGAADRWRAMILAQGGDPHAPLAQASERDEIRAPASGWLRRLDARAVGVAAGRLGAGRARKEEPVSPSAGVVWHAGVGGEVVEGQPLLELHADDPARFPAARAALGGAWEIGPEPADVGPLVIERIRP